MKKLFCTLISAVTLISMTACVTGNSPDNASLSLTFNGTEASVPLTATADDLKAVMDSFGLTYDCYDYEELPYTGISSYIDNFGLDLIVDHENNTDGIYIYRGENFSGSFSLLGITEKSTVSDVKALFGEPALNDINNEGGENFLWNADASGRPCDLWIFTGSDGMIIGINLSFRKSTGKEGSFPFTLDGKKTEINLGWHSAEIKKCVEEDLNRAASFAFCNTAYIYDDGFELGITTDSYGVSSLSVFQFEEADNSFDLFGITEKSTIDDITALFGEYDERLAGDAEYEEFCWENVEVAGTTCRISATKPLNSDKFEIIYVIFARNIAGNQVKG